MEFEAVFNNYGKNKSASFSLSLKFWTVAECRMHLYVVWKLKLDYNSINNCHFKLLYIFSILKRYILFREFIDSKILKRISISIIWVGDPNKLICHNIIKQIHYVVRPWRYGKWIIHQCYMQNLIISMSLLIVLNLST